MKISALLLLFVALSFSLAKADDLTTRDGKVYKNYKVLSHDDAFLTILYADGGGKIPLGNLPDALQKQYGYDPAKAAAAQKQADAPDQAAQEALKREKAKATAQHEQQAAQDAAAAAAPVAPPAGTAAPTTPAASNDPSVDVETNKVLIANKQLELDELQRRSDAYKAGVLANDHTPDPQEKAAMEAFKKKLAEKQAEIDQIQAQNDAATEKKPAVPAAK